MPSDFILLSSTTSRNEKPISDAGETGEQPRKKELLVNLLDTG
jgi:hypothetical protein